MGKTELGRWLQAADVVVTPYPNLEQTVSGTLSYAMGAGKAVVSTPFAYASELLGGGRGVLAKPDPAAVGRRADRPAHGRAPTAHPGRAGRMPSAGTCSGPRSASATSSSSTG